MQNDLSKNYDSYLNSKLVSIKEASNLLSDEFNRKISISNISYLINYGKIQSYTRDGKVLININELVEYYKSKIYEKRKRFEEKEGKDLNWHLSFDWVKESERTKHVHRIHPYKGKFIPQLVEYFLDEHINDLKEIVYFKRGDTILDPFAGSGTTLIQANELGLNSIGLEISEFNSLLTEVKFAVVDIMKLKYFVREISLKLHQFEKEHKIEQIQNIVDKEINQINNIYFKSPQFKIEFREGRINECYIKEKEKIAKNKYRELLKHEDFEFSLNLINNSFLRSWLAPSIYQELIYVSKNIQTVSDEEVKKALIIIMSRSIHSARATTHTDLDRLKVPVYEPYFCYKHFKICKPVLSISRFFDRYSFDTIKRLLDYKRIKTEAYQCIITGDSRQINIFNEIKKQNPDFFSLIKSKKIDGIFTSPPYLGQLDYHDLHAYAYEFFGIGRHDDLEIGASSNGKGIKARLDYIDGISEVLINVKKFLKDKAHIFIVANDQFSLYPEIAEKAGLIIEKQFKRPVLNRTSRDKNPYSETVFYMRIKE